MIHLIPKRSQFIDVKRTLFTIQLLDLRVCGVLFSLAISLFYTYFADLYDLLSSVQTWLHALCINVQKRSTFSYLKNFKTIDV